MIRLAVFTKNRTNPAYAAARIGADRAAAALGAAVTHFVPDTPDDPDEQSALIDLALTTQPDAFVLSPVHATRVDPAIRRIAAAAIPMVSFVNPIGVVPSVAFVGADDMRLSQELAAYLFKYLQGSGRVLVITGPEHSITSLDRLRGFMQTVAQYPGIAIAGQFAGDYSRAVARTRTTAWLRKHESPDAFLVANDIMAVGVLDAMEEVDCVRPIVGINAIPEAIAAIATGRMLATADFNAMQMACLATECAIRYLRNQAVPKTIELPVQIVDQTNYVAWNDPYQERPLFGLHGAFLD